MTKGKNTIYYNILWFSDATTHAFKQKFQTNIALLRNLT